MSDAGSCSVLIVGVGALGCPAALLLARAGIGHLTLIDPDIVETSNLQRQVLYREADVGQPKAEAAARRLAGFRAAITTVRDRLDTGNADAQILAHDFTIDACDDPSTKFLINAAATRVGRPYSYGGVARTGGLTLTVLPGVSACLACVFAGEESTSAQQRDVAGCHEAGVLAPVAGVIGAFQAAEALSTLGLSGHRRTHAGTLVTYELRGRRWRFMKFARNDRCTVCATERRIESCRS